MISANNVSVVFGGFTLLDAVSFLVNKKDRIGLTGRNGAGKSTLLKILAGVEEPTSGSVSKAGDVRIGYLPQTMVYKDGNTVRQEAEKAFADLFALRKEVDRLNGELAERTDYESEGYMKLLHCITEKSEQLAMRGEGNVNGEVEVVLKGLGFTAADMDRRCEEFSGGWRMRIELAKILLAKPDIFLLDEPTNHLDIESISWLEAFLQTYPGAVVLVSHDRAFLDNVTNRTIEISLGKVYDYKVSYTRFTELRKERISQQLRAYENQQKQIKDTEEFIERFRYKATKAVQVQSRIKQLEKIERIEVEQEDTARINIRFQPAVRSGEMVVCGRSLKKCYGEKLVLQDLDIDILRGEKVAFVGKNGEGKSTLVKMIMGEIPYEGNLKLGHNVNIGYFAQNQADLMDTDLTVLDTIDRVAVGEIRKKMRDILGAFLFSGEEVDKKVGVLSGGERTRLAMARLLLEPYNVLILDEPTNHLDLRTKDILKEALRNFEGTVIVVSHDRAFLTGLADKVFEFANHGVKEYLGGVDDFLEAKKVACFSEYERWKNRNQGGAVKKLEVEKEPERKVEERKMSFEERKQWNREIKKAERRIEDLEKEIAGWEKKIAEMEGRMVEVGSDEQLYKEYDKAKKSLDCCMAEWEVAHADLERLKTGI
ncbi:ABC-F family ATP-binding cassette domain-containing protein [Odoribacter lunatus]|uniref:ABC-F family ATP-binding cassette domain-containing protein n=1 Tax=Odoribacter lunatus TaxID=2941335 RepID=UPI00203CA3BD|nr:ABC-F family ATP-binding cassette domain-containing protein [Odoribacter lunatus]